MSRRPPPSRPFLNLLCSLCTFPCAASCERFWTVHRCCRRILYHPDPAPSTPALLPPFATLPQPTAHTRAQTGSQACESPRRAQRHPRAPEHWNVAAAQVGPGPTPPPTPPNTSMASAHQLAASHCVWTSCLVDQALPHSEQVEPSGRVGPHTETLGDVSSLSANVRFEGVR